MHKDICTNQALQQKIKNFQLNLIQLSEYKNTNWKANWKKIPKKIQFQTQLL